MANWKPEPLVPPDLGNLLNFITKKMSIHIGLIFLKKITLTVNSEFQPSGLFKKLVKMAERIVFCIFFPSSSFKDFLNIFHLSH